MLPTTTAADADASGGSSPSDVTLTDAVVRTELGTRLNSRHLLPTPTTEPESGNGHARDLGGEIRLLKTPTSNLGSNGGAQHPDKRKEGGHGPTLADEVEHLLPTPRTTDSHGVGVHGSGGQDLRTMIAALDETDERVPATLLPTPTTAMATGGNARRGGARSDELLLAGIAQELDETDLNTDERWGAYWAAVDRWERLLDQQAPEPTLADGKNGRRRMNAALPEWMMGLRPGHLVDVPGVNRQQALKLAGNGVVPQQAALAVRTLLEGWES